MNNSKIPPPCQLFTKLCLKHPPLDSSTKESKKVVINVINK